MSDSTLTRELPPFLSKLPPTRDELPSSYDDKLESLNHVLNLTLLMLTLQRYLSGIRDAFIATNMFVYFSPDQVKTHDFKGPDFFVVLDVPPGPRSSWVVWDEDGRGPDIVIEMLSDSTAAVDKGEKLLVYQDRLRVEEYFWFHPLTGAPASGRCPTSTSRSRLKPMAACSARRSTSSLSRGMASTRASPDDGCAGRSRTAHSCQQPTRMH